ncbi:SPOR domain-containing protein [Candidatus Neomarinimicrobiota bacterium]
MTLWKNWPSSLYAVLCFVFVLPLHGQDLAYYVELASQGRTEAVKQAIPGLKRQYPNSGSVLYLEGLLTEDGDEAVKTFQQVSTRYPNNEYADDALMKQGEYLYSRGLYIQAANILKKIPIHHPKSDLVYPSIRLFLNSLLVTGDRDTALFYTQVFAKKYTDLVFDLSEGKVRLAESGLSTRASADLLQEPAPAMEVESVTNTSAMDDGFVLQVGAFGVRANAIRQKELLESMNYRAKISPITRSERILYMVTVVGFANKQMALAAGKKLSNVLGVDFLLIEPD